MYIYIYIYTMNICPPLRNRLRSTFSTTIFNYNSHYLCLTVTLYLSCHRVRTDFYTEWSPLKSALLAHTLVVSILVVK